MRFNQKMAMRAALVALPLVLVSAALFVASQKRREIVNLWTLVPGTEGCTLIPGSMWRSNDEVVCVPAFQGGTTLLSVDARDGKRKKLAVTPTNQGIFGNFGVVASPDGKWVLWPSGMAGWNAMTLDGKQFIQRPRATTSTAGLRVAWLPDSSGWVECSQYGLNGRNGETVLIIYKTNTAKTRVIDVPEADGINNFQVTQKARRFFRVPNR